MSLTDRIFTGMKALVLLVGIGLLALSVGVNIEEIAFIVAVLLALSLALAVLLSFITGGKPPKPPFHSFR